MVAFVNTSLNDPGCTGQTGLVALTRGTAGVAAAGVATTAGVVRVAGACVTTRADAGGAGGDGRAVMFEAVDAAAEAVTFAATEGVVVAGAVDRGVALVAEGEANVSGDKPEGAGAVDRAEPAVAAG